MGNEDGAGTQHRRKRSKSKRLRYFYLEGDQLHKVLMINRPQNLVVAWNYTQGKRVAYVLSEVRKKMKKAYTKAEVADMLGRHLVRIDIHMRSGGVRMPQRIYSLDGNKTPGKYMFSDKDIYELHDYLMTIHRGRPRHDGRVTPSRLPSKVELRAMLNSDTALYIKNKDGEFVQVFKENDW